MKLKIYPQVYYSDENGKQIIREIRAYGRRFEFQYDEDGKIVLKEIVG